MIIFAWVLVGLGLLVGPGAAVLWPVGVTLLIINYKKRRPKCTACKSKLIIPLDTPAGQEIVRSLESKDKV
jgi:hypothetical protein